MNEWKKETVVVPHLWVRKGPGGLGVESRIRQGCISNASIISSVIVLPQYNFQGCVYLEKTP